MLAASEHLDQVLATLLAACEVIARELAPFLPQAAERIDQALRELDATQGRTLFRKLPAPAARDAPCARVATRPGCVSPRSLQEGLS